MRTNFSSLALLATTAAASFDGNINFGSPSARHAGLGIDVGRVAARTLKRSAVPFTPEELSFTHGVASGDPWANSVILWTRVAPTATSDASNVTVEGNVALYNHETDPYIRADPNPICVDWAVYADKHQGHGNGKPGKRPVSKGRAYTTSDIDYTVKVEAKGLKPLTTYSYQFTVCDSENASPMGRTKTAPAKHGRVDELKFAVFSCSNYPNGYFNVYGNAARKDEHDFVLHLGDYIYEYGATGERASEPLAEIFTLHDYRTRHGQYRSDADLQLLSKDFAWIATWDDHEISNNGYRDGSSGLSNDEESFINDGGVSVDQRKMNAVRAYFEWMPIRQTDMDDGLRVWRNFEMGNLMDLIILDTRNYDRSITTLSGNDDYIEMISNDAGRTLMGGRQESWFYNSLSKSHERGATWRLVGNQIIFSHIVESWGTGFNGDNWNGYLANRNRTLQHLYDNGINNNLFLAGDSHQSWVSDLTWEGEKPYDPQTGEGAIGVEFAGTAVSSSGQDGPIPYARQMAEERIGNNTVLQWQDGYYRGYFVLTVTPEKVDAQFYGSPSVASRNAWDLPLANFSVAAGANHLARPVAGGSVEAGALLGGETVPTNLTLNTETGEWEVIGFPTMYLENGEVE